MVRVKKYKRKNGTEVRSHSRKKPEHNLKYSASDYASEHSVRNIIPDQFEDEGQRLADISVMTKKQKAKQLEMKARRQISSMSLPLLIDSYNHTNSMHIGEDVATVRGWILDELERRDKRAFDRFVDAATDDPRPFFINPNPIVERNDNSFVGSKYNRNRDVADIAKEVKKRIAKLPGVEKVSVRIERYAGGRSINVYFKELSYNPINPEWVKQYRTDPYNTKTGDAYRYIPKAQELLRAAESILNEYNYDRSDSRTDYFDVNFYGFVKLDYEYEEKMRQKILASFGG